MANKEKMDYLLIDVRELEKLIAGMRDAEIYPVSFFSQSFELTHKILKDLHTLEAAQVELLRRQMEEHEAILRELPYIPSPQPASTEVKPSGEILADTIPDPVPPPVEPEPLIDAAEKEVPPEQPVAPAVEEPDGQPLPVAPAPQPPVSPQPPVPPTLVDRVSPQNLSIHEVLEKRKLSDFRKAFSLNDRFYFRRELFAGNEGRMNQVIDRLNDLHTYDESLAYLKHELEWNLDDQAVVDFVKLLEKRFS